MFVVEPWREESNDPAAFLSRRRIHRRDDAAALPFLRRAVPTCDEPELIFREFGKLVEAVIVARLPLVGEHVFLVLQRTEVEDAARVKAPAMQ